MRRTSSPAGKDRDPLVLLLDTHIWLWLMFATGDLSSRRRSAVDRAIGAGRARISAISFWEIAMLARRGKVQLGKATSLWIADSLSGPSPSVEPLSIEIAVEAGELPGGFRSDPADMIIVATARLTGATLMTRDRRILEYAGAGYLNAMRA
jgi:PIN domain nuclease of toxin-antitoxin system